MKTQRIYTDTSVIGGCFDKEFALWSNGLMEDFRLGRFRPVVSELVSAEIEDAPEYVKIKYAGLLALNPEILKIGEQVFALADMYQERNILTPKFYDDGDTYRISIRGRNRCSCQLEFQTYRTLRQDTHVQCYQSGIRL